MLLLLLSHFSRVRLCARLAPRALMEETMKEVKAYKEELDLGSIPGRGSRSHMPQLRVHMPQRVLLPRLS